VKPYNMISGDYIAESIWKEQLQGAVADYVINPCLKTAQKMLTIAMLRKDDKTQVGVISAIAEEARRLGVGDYRSAAAHVYFAGLNLIKLLTRRENTWNDYYTLRWTFRQDPAAVVALHSRAHSKDAQARENAEVAVIKLLSDPEFRAVFYSVARDVDCERCRGAVARYMDRSGNPERLPAA
jgi:hypothetical protein